MAEPLWLDQELLTLLHEDILAETGGLAGVRDAGLLASALARPLNRYAYEGVEDLAELAATYTVAIASNHPFLDGNKRTAFMALCLFLEENGGRLTATDADATEVMLAVACGDCDIAALTAWINANLA